MLFFINSDGIPVYDVTIYSLYELRSRNLSSNTIENVLRAIYILYLYLEQYDYDLSILVRSGKIATVEVVESLAQFSNKQIKDIKKDLIKNKITNKYKIASLEKVRAKEPQDRTNLVHPGVSLTRLIYIRNYITSFITRMIYQEQFGSLNRKVIIPFLVALQSRAYAACFSFMAGVIPPMPMFGRSLL